ncbi:hypothetical protein [Streptomyces sp. NPDC127084]|uniref:hypothetical protein n=1 Tax=Streptomyces sp. NPDC127084 TaxID=3347133 RepID=UPI0036461881
MEETQIAAPTQKLGAPLTLAEKEQARYALRELVRSKRDPKALRMTQEQFEMVQPFFELGWAMGVRTGHTGRAVADVPVDRLTVYRAILNVVGDGASDHLALAVARSLAPHSAGPVLWQKVRYHGSLTRRHGLYWVKAIRAEADPVGGAHSVSYDLCEVIGGIAVPAVTRVRRQSLTPLPEHRAAV